MNTYLVDIFVFDGSSFQTLEYANDPYKAATMTRQTLRRNGMGAERYEIKAVSEIKFEYVSETTITPAR